MYSSWAVPHTGLQNTEPHPGGSFLNITIISLYCNARTDWLSPGESNTDPRVIRVGSRRGDTIFSHTHIHTHTRAQSLLHSETKQNILNAPLPTITRPPIQGFSVDMAYKRTRGPGSSPGFNCCLRTERQVNWTAWGFQRPRKTRKDDAWYRRPRDRCQIAGKNTLFFYFIAITPQKI